MARLFNKDLTPEAFRRLLEETKIPDTAIAWIDGPTSWRFLAWDDPGWRDTRLDEATASESGRIFDVSGELRWRRIDFMAAGISDGEDERQASSACDPPFLFRTLFLGEAWEALSGHLEDTSEVLEDLVPHASRHPFWGEREGKVWIERKIPHHFRYPAEGRRIVIEVERWVAPDGMTAFLRFRSLQPFDEEK